MDHIERYTSQIPLKIVFLHVLKNQNYILWQPHIYRQIWAI